MLPVQVNLSALACCIIKVFYKPGNAGREMQDNPISSCQAKIKGDVKTVS
jgi:hypothetical protein